MFARTNAVVWSENLLIDTEHAGIFVAVLRAFANPLRDAGIDQCLPFWIRVENRLKSRGLRRNLGAEGVAWDETDQGLAEV